MYGNKINIEKEQNNYFVVKFRKYLYFIFYINDIVILNLVLK